MSRRADRLRPRAPRGGVPAPLIGLLLVVVIIIVAITMNSGGGSSYVETVAEGRRQGQQLDVTLDTRSLVQLVTAHHVQNNRYPTSYEDMEATPLRDPWGNVLAFTIDTSTRPPTLVVTSPGPDNQAGTEDDIVRRETLAM